MTSPLRNERRLVSLSRMSRSGVLLGKLVGSIRLNGAMASTLSTAAASILESKGTSQRCGREMVAVGSAMCV